MTISTVQPSSRGNLDKPLHEWKTKILWLRKGGGPLKDRRNQQNKSVGI